MKNALKTITLSLLLAACGGSPFTTLDAVEDAGRPLAPPPPRGGDAGDSADAGSPVGDAGSDADAAPVVYEVDGAVPACAPGDCTTTAACQLGCESTNDTCQAQCVVEYGEDAGGPCRQSCGLAQISCSHACAPTCQACATAYGCAVDCSTPQ